MCGCESFGTLFVGEITLSQTPSESGWSAGCGDGVQCTRSRIGRRQVGRERGNAGRSFGSGCGFANQSERTDHGGWGDTVSRWKGLQGFQTVQFVVFRGSGPTLRVTRKSRVVQSGVCAHDGLVCVHERTESLEGNDHGVDCQENGLVRATASCGGAIGAHDSRSQHSDGLVLFGSGGVARHGSGNGIWTYRCLQGSVR